MSILRLVYQIWSHLFWVPKLSRKSQPTEKSLKPGLNSIILGQSYHRAMASWASASDSSFRGFTKKNKLINFSGYHCPNYFSRSAPEDKTAVKGKNFFLF